MIAGVCSGIAHYFGIDPVLVRLGAVILGFAGMGIVAYLLAWVLIPEANSESDEPGTGRKRNFNTILALVLILFASAALVDEMPWWNGDVVFPLVLVGGGALLLWKKTELFGRRDEGPPVWPTGPAPGPAAGGWSDPSASPWTDPTDDSTWTDPTWTDPTDDSTWTDPTDDSTWTDPTDDSDWTEPRASDWTDQTEPVIAPSPGPSEQRPSTDTYGERPGWSDGRNADPQAAAGYSFAGGPPYTASRPWPPPPPPPGPWQPERKARRSIVPWALLLIGLGAVGLLVAAGANFDVSDVVAGALLLVGLFLVVGAWFGRARWLIFAGLVLFAILSFTAFVNVPLSGGIGDRNFEPDAIGEVDDEYRLAIGKLIVDLSELPVQRGDTVDIEASVGMGELLVIVPRGVTVDVDGHVGAGEVDAFGHSNEGVDVDLDVVEAGLEGSGQITLDLRGGLGKVQVQRDSP